MSRLSRRLGRRRFLHGLGGVSLALPVSSWFWPREPMAQPAGSVPPRYIGLFFGNGFPKEYSEGGFANPQVAALAPLQAKLAMCRGIHYETAEYSRVKNLSAGNDHTPGSGSFAIGRPLSAPQAAGGPSLDVVAYEKFAPVTPLRTLNAAIWWRETEPLRHLISWREAGVVNDPIRRPVDLFAHLFGDLPSGASAMDPSMDAQLEQARLQRKSVLDAVMAEYQYVVGQRSDYGAEAKALVTDHLETLRVIESKLGASEQVACDVPNPPSELEFEPERFDATWTLMSELYTLAMRCDLARFGTHQFTCAGDKFVQNGRFGDPHELGHRWRTTNENGFDVPFRWYLEHMAEFLLMLDDPSFVDLDGRTVLDNTLVLLGTEVSNPNHAWDNCTFLLAGATGTIQPGVYEYGDQKNDVDLFNTVSRAIGIEEPFGDMSFFNSTLEGVV